MKLPLYVGAIALTLTFSAYAEPPPHVALFPGLYKCFDLLRLESLQLQFDEQNRLTPRNPNDIALLNEFFGVAGWLRGFFTGINTFGFTPDGDATKGTTPKEWMPWIYSYCQAHPTENLENVAMELAKALSSGKDRN